MMRLWAGYVKSRAAFVLLLFAVLVSIVGLSATAPPLLPTTQAAAAALQPSPRPPWYATESSPTPVPTATAQPPPPPASLPSEVSPTPLPTATATPIPQVLPATGTAPWTLIWLPLGAILALGALGLGLLRRARHSADREQ